ncbi:hypothetical protein LTR56_027381, partial [Elasticomyces elasticus]
LFATTYFLNLYLIEIRFLSPVVSGTVFVSFAVTVTVVSGLAGLYITEFGSYRWSIWFGWLINTASLGSLMLLSPTTFLPGIVFACALAGIGHGFLLTGHQVASQAPCAPDDLPFASAIFGTMRSFGFFLGIAVGGALFQLLLAHQVDHFDVSRTTAADVTALTLSLRSFPSGPEKDLLLGACDWTFRYIWAVLTGVSGLGMLSSFFVAEVSLDRDTKVVSSQWSSSSTLV